MRDMYDGFLHRWELLRHDRPRDTARSGVAETIKTQKNERFDKIVTNVTTRCGIMVGREKTLERRSVYFYENSEREN